MNAQQPLRQSPSPDQRPVQAATAVSDRRQRRERDFGVGYGNSSGYASARRYTDGRADPLFRCR